MIGAPCGVHALVLAAVVWRYDALAGSLPTSCVYDHNLVVCRDAHRLNLTSLAAAVMMEYVVTFVYLKSAKTLCNCRTVHFTKVLKNADIFVMTSSKCDIRILIRCGVEIPLVEPVQVAGLVVSRENPKLRWGVKHHVIDLCNKIEDLPDKGIRTVLYQSFVHELYQGEKRLEKMALARGDLLFYHQVNLATQFQTLVTTPPAQSGDEQSDKPMIVASYESEPMAHLSNIMQDAMLRINKAQADDELPYTPKPSESELQTLLSNEMNEIKRNYKKHGKREVQHSKRDPFLTTDSLTHRFIGESGFNRNTKTDRIIRDSLPLEIVSESWNKRIMSDSMHNRMQMSAFLHNKSTQFQERRSMPHQLRKKSAPRATPQLLPQKVFVDGEYVSIFDSNTILEDLELEVPITTSANPFTTQKAMHTFMTQRPPDEHKNPVAHMLFPSRDEAMAHALSQGMLDLKDEDVDDDLDNEDSLMVDTLDPAGEALMNAKMKLKKITKVPKVTPLPLATVSVKSLKVLQEEHRESDHRIKSFVVFFVCVIGIIGVIGVLLVLAIKRRPSKDKYSVFDVPKRRTEKERRQRQEQLLKQHEDLMDKKRKIHPVYSDAETPEEVIPFIDPLTGRRTATSRPTQTQDDVIKNRPILKKKQIRTLGGRHVHSAFETLPSENQIRNVE
uniref:Uncharacterized protein n=1 Tax=Biomphalaria glabrata TaxID=6526 RepID=A0A2C9JVC3_BIOGL